MSAEEQGMSEERYRLIPRTLIFLTRGDQILLIKGASNKKLWADKYNGVGGHIELDENILDAARREIYEETGLTPDDLWLCGIVTVNTGLNTGIGIFVFRGECLHGRAKESKEGELSWINQADYPSLPLVDDLYQLLPWILAMRKHQSPLIAHTNYNVDGKMSIKIIK